MRIARTVAHCLVYALLTIGHGIPAVAQLSRAGMELGQAWGRLGFLFLEKKQ